MESVTDTTPAHLEMIRSNRIYRMEPGRAVWNPDIPYGTWIFRTSKMSQFYDEIAASSWLSYRLSLWASLIKWLILRLSDPEEITSAQTLETPNMK